MDEPCKTANSRLASRGLHIHEIAWHRCNCACLCVNAAEVFGPKIISVQLCKYYRYSHGSTLTALQGYYSLTGMLMFMHFLDYFTPADSFCSAFIMATYLTKYIQYWITSSMTLLLTSWAVFAASPQLTQSLSLSSRLNSQLLLPFGEFQFRYRTNNVTFCAVNWTKRPESRDRGRCFGLLSDSGTVDKQRASGANELWRRQIGAWSSWR